VTEGGAAPGGNVRFAARSNADCYRLRRHLRRWTSAAEEKNTTQKRGEKFKEYGKKE